ncbi:MAG: hypothetical protein LBB15_02310 [Puniceicoccales bacterium]|jgi:hypothetical protein|nr:hypothetical protein [Puniceicoccales bacterium]
MGDPLGGIGSSSSVPLPVGPKRAKEAPVGSLVRGALPDNAAVKHRAKDDSNITPKALAERTVEVTTGRKGSASLKGGIKADARVAPNAARQENATTITARVVAYGDDVERTIKRDGAPFDQSGIQAHTERCSGYLNRLAEATIRNSNGVPQTNPRDRIQVIYDQAYSVGDPSQAKKSAGEISSALRQAVPEGVRNNARCNLGTIGGDIPVGMQAADFNDAKLKLNELANAIFNDPSCDGLYSPAEQRAVKELVINRALEYAKTANVDVNDAMKLVRDNLIKIHHQQKVDHQVISGSDHGVRHVIQSNVAHTLNALDSEQLSGLVSPKEKLMAMQIMIDHDLGYTLDAAKGDFGAAKDHPLASTAYMEFGGQASGVFTDDEQKFMRDAVLKHSYPFDLDKPFNFPAGDDADAQKARQTAIAGIVSVVDAMGVTANTKCPALYREILTPEIMQELAMDDGPEIRKNLHAIIDQAVKDGKISQDTAEGYHQALDYDVSKWGAQNMILPQFGGKLLGTEMEPAGDEGSNQYALHITFGVSEEIRNMATVFGDRVALNAFNKMANDLFPNLARGELEKAASEVERSLKSYAARTLPNGAVKLTLTKLQE